MTHDPSRQLIDQLVSSTFDLPYITGNHLELATLLTPIENQNALLAGLRCLADD